MENFSSPSFINENNELANAKRALSDYRNQLIQREELCKKFNTTISILETKLSISAKNLDDVKNENFDYKSGILQLEISNKKKQEAIMQLTQTIDNYSIDLKSKQNLIEEINTQLNELKLNENVKLSDVEVQIKLEQQLNEHLQTIKALTLTFETQVKSLEQNFLLETEQLQIQIQKLQEEVSFQIELEKELIQKVEEKQSLIESLTQTNFEIQNNPSFENLIHEWEEKFKNSQSQIESYQIQNTELSTLNATYTEQITKITNELNYINDKQTNEFAEKQKLSQSQLDSYQLQNIELTSQNISYLEQIKNLKLQIELNQGKKDDFLEKETQLNTHIQSQTAITQQLQTQITELEQNKINLLTNNDQLKVELHNQQLQNSYLIDYVNHISFELESTFDIYKSTQQLEFDKLVVENELLIEEVETQANQFTTSYEALQSQLNNSISSVKELQNAVFQKSEEINQLKIEFEESEAKFNNQELTQTLININHKRCSLLQEKGEIADQLLKMNHTISTILYHLKSNDVQVVEFNNSTNLSILANELILPNQTNEVIEVQIGELVQEIDKCISLLSA